MNSTSLFVRILQNDWLMEFGFILGQSFWKSCGEEFNFLSTHFIHVPMYEDTHHGLELHMLYIRVMSIHPGTFHTPDTIEGDLCVKHQDSETSASPSIDQPDSSFGQAATLFKERFGIPTRIIYPACGCHSIGSLFPESEVVYVDPSLEDISLLQGVISSKARALAMTIENFQDATLFDLLVSLNSHAPMEAQLRQLRPGGFVLCNYYFGTKDAERIMQLGSCKLLAIIDSMGDNQTHVMKTDGLEPYLELRDSRNLTDLDAQRTKVAAYYVFKKLEGEDTND